MILQIGFEKQLQISDITSLSSKKKNWKSNYKWSVPSLLVGLILLILLHKQYRAYRIIIGGDPVHLEGRVIRICVTNQSAL